MKKPPNLRQRALAVLARREISRAELARKLQPFCENNDELTALLDDLAAHHWQSDARFTEAYIHSKSHVHGNLRLRQALAAKGVDADLVRDHLPDAAMQSENACALMRKKFKRAPANLTEKHQCMRFLAYRGFDMDSIQAALKKAWDNE